MFRVFGQITLGINPIVDYALQVALGFGVSAEILIHHGSNGHEQ